MIPLGFWVGFLVGGFDWVGFMLVCWFLGLAGLGLVGAGCLLSEFIRTW